MFNAGSLTLQVAGEAELRIELFDARLTRATPEEKSVTAKAAQALLAVEVRQAEVRKIAIIADVLTATVVGVPPRIRDADALAGRLRAIAGYMSCWAVNTREAFKPVPIEVSRLLKEPQAASLMALAVLEWQQAIARWQEYRIEPAIDPDAKAPTVLGRADDADMMVAVEPLSGDLVRTF